MKKLIITAGICIVSILGVQAQTLSKSTPTFDQKVDKMLTSITTACNLTPDQVTKAKPIIAEAIKARMANRQQYGTDKDKLKAANQETMKTENTKMYAILNADQQAKLTSFESQKKAEMQKKKAAK